MIKIILDNNVAAVWGNGEYTSFKCDGKFFKVMKDSKCVGVCDLSRVKSILIKK